MVTKSTKSTMARRTRPLLAAVMAFLLVLGWQVGHPPAAFADGPTTFSNDTAIAIPASGSAQQIGPASPYPSSITVSGMSGPISKVTVTFHNLTHGSLNDIDAMVVAPDGENLIVLSDAANENTYTYASNATLTFDDAAANRVPVRARSRQAATSRPTIPSAAPTPSPRPRPPRRTRPRWPAPSPASTTPTAPGGSTSSTTPPATSARWPAGGA